MGACGLEVHGHIAGGLGGPGRAGVCGRAGDPHAAGGVLDHREDVQRRSGQCFGLEEVGGEDGLGLGAQEGRSGGVLAFGCGVDAVFLEDVPHGAGGDLDTEDGEFAVDAPVPPAGILSCQL